jgi:NRAMP (natural resistance-associated macrophage protein)-like metal ion transporter
MKPKKGLIEKVAEVPARMLEETIEFSAKATGALPGVKRAEKFWHLLGPGLTTGAADDDPSGITTYSQTGARYGFQLLWLSVFTFPFMAIVQEMCARIGLVTGRGLAGNIRHHFPRPVLYLCAILLLIANTFNIGADLGAMAQGMQLLLPNVPTSVFLIGFTFLSLGLQIFTPYAKYANYLKWLAMILFAYIFSALLAGLDWHQVWRHTLFPSMDFSKDQILLVSAVLGTTISPYLFFWQTSQEMEEEILLGRKTLKLRRGATDREIRRMRIDVWSGMFFSNIVMFFIIAACAGALFTHGITTIESSAQAAEALRPLAGDATYFLFAIGIVGTGLLALPVLAGSSSYALAESFGWKKMGLYRKLKTAEGFYGVIILSMFVGLGMNFLGINPIKALIWSAVLNAIVSPVVLILIVLLSSNREIMGKRTNGRLTKFFGWLIVGVMIAAGIGALVSMF